jgi:hypothetical protein
MRRWVSHLALVGALLDATAARPQADATPSTPAEQIVPSMRRQVHTGPDHARREGVA